MAKNNNTKIITPVGVSQYAWLTTADTRFDEIGHFKTNLIVETDKVQQTIKAKERKSNKLMLHILRSLMMMVNLQGILFSSSRLKHKLFLRTAR